MDDIANVDLYQPSPYVYMQKVQNVPSFGVYSTDFKEGDTLPAPQLSAAFGVRSCVSSIGIMELKLLTSTFI